MVWYGMVSISICWTSFTFNTFKILGEGNVTTFNISLVCYIFARLPKVLHNSVVFAFTSTKITTNYSKLFQGWDDDPDPVSQYNLS